MSRADPINTAAGCPPWRNSNYMRHAFRLVALLLAVTACEPAAPAAPPTSASAPSSAAQAASTQAPAPTQPAAASASGSRTLTWASGVDVETMDPMVGTSSVSQSVMHAVFDGL